MGNHLTNCEHIKQSGFCGLSVRCHGNPGDVYVSLFTGFYFTVPNTAVMYQFSQGRR